MTATATATATATDYAALFPISDLAESFNDAIVRDAAHGGVSTAFCIALQKTYDLALALTPVSAMKQINTFIGTAKAPTKKQGWEHGTAKAVAVAQALHALGLALFNAGKVKGLTGPLSLSAWCDPVILSATAEAKAKAKAEAKAEATSEAEAEVIVTETAPVSNNEEITSDIVAKIKAGFFSADNLDAISAAIVKAIALAEAVRVANAKAEAEATAEAKAEATA